MKASGLPPGEEAGLEQEGIWEGPGVTPERGSADAGSSRGLTRGITSTERVPGPAGLMLADVPNRIMALIIDIIVLSVTGFLLAWLFGGLVSRPGALDSPGGQLDVTAFLIVLLMQLIISLGYFGGFWVLLSATPGMRLLGLRVGDASDGLPLAKRQALMRWLLLGVPSLLVSLALYVPSSVAVVLAGFGLAWLLLLLYTMAQSPIKQGLHDRWARTIVVRARRRAT
jgi:uncharacterized RDD family membrane protein YckC